MSERQYVAVKFNPDATRFYTYHNNGEPCMVGDKVRVPTRNGTQVCWVVELPPNAPSFDTRPILQITKRVKRPEAEAQPVRDEEFDFGTVEPVEIAKGRITKQTIRKATEP